MKHQQSSLMFHTDLESVHVACWCSAYTLSKETKYYAFQKQNTLSLQWCLLQKKPKPGAHLHLKTNGEHRTVCYNDQVWRTTITPEVEIGLRDSRLGKLTKPGPTNARILGPQDLFQDYILGKPYWWAEKVDLDTSSRSWYARKPERISQQGMRG